jgi:formate transporter
VILAVASKDIAGKLWGIFFPIMAFVASSFEHCVANMYFIPAAIFAKNSSAAIAASGLTPAQLDGINWTSMWTQNLVSVTLGNIVAGAVFAGVVYFYVYIMGSEAPGGACGIKES